MYSVLQQSRHPHVNIQILNNTLYSTSKQGCKGVNAKSRGGVKEFSVEVLLFHRLAGPWSEAPLYSEEHTELKVCREWEMLYHDDEDRFAVCPAPSHLYLIRKCFGFVFFVCNQHAKMILCAKTLCNTKCRTKKLNGNALYGFFQ